MSFKLPYAKHLLNDEVDFELRVRNYLDDTNLDLHAKYELLQKLYHEDSQEKREYLSIYTIEQDYDFILSRVTSIELALRDKKDPKLISRLKYYYVRAKNSRVDSPQSKEMRDALVRDICNLLAAVGVQLQPVSEQEQNQEDQGNPDEGAASLPVQQTGHVNNSGGATPSGNNGNEPLLDLTADDQNQHNLTFGDFGNKLSPIRNDPKDSGTIPKVSRETGAIPKGNKPKPVPLSIEPTREQLMEQVATMKKDNEALKDAVNKLIDRLETVNLNALRNQVTNPQGSTGGQVERKNPQFNPGYQVPLNWYQPQPTPHGIPPQQHPQGGLHKPQFNSGVPLLNQNPQLCQWPQKSQSDRINPQFNQWGEQPQGERVNLQGNQMQQPMVINPQVNLMQQPTQINQTQAANHNNQGGGNQQPQQNNHVVPPTQNNQVQTTGRIFHMQRSPFGNERDANGRFGRLRNDRYDSEDDSEFSDEYGRNHDAPRRRRKEQYDRRIEKWNVFFSGEPRSTSLEDFIHKVKMLAKMNSISDSKLLCHIHLLLRSEASDWFFTYYEDDWDWATFEENIRFRFGNPNQNQGNRQRIYDRKQQRGETFTAFLSDIDRMNKLLTKPLSRKRTFQIVWENMQQRYRSKLACFNVENLTELKDLCHRIDANDPSLYPVSSRHVVNNVEAEQQETESEEELNAIDRRNQRQSENRNWRTQDRTRERPVEGYRTNAPHETTRLPLCWNCRQHGHFWRQCHEEKSTFCYVCGNAGTVAATCNIHPRRSAPVQTTQTAPGSGPQQPQSGQNLGN